MPQPVIAIVGPTAAGKSGLSLQLARLLDGEIVNADSMQLYRGMDIGTAKLPPDQREGVPHHLLDIWDVTAAANVAEYQRRARRGIDAIHARGRPPIVVGGSGLYVRAVIDNLDFPGTDPELRERLEHELAEVGPAAMHAKLARLDPAAADAILPGTARRFARRQLSWFRRDPRITWLSAGEPELAGRAMATIESCGLPRATERATTSWSCPTP